MLRTSTLSQNACTLIEGCIDLEIELHRSQGAGPSVTGFSCLTELSCTCCRLYCNHQETSRNNSIFRIIYINSLDTARRQALVYNNGRFITERGFQEVSGVCWRHRCVDKGLVLCPTTIQHVQSFHTQYPDPRGLLLQCWCRCMKSLTSQNKQSSKRPHAGTKRDAHHDSLVGDPTVTAVLLHAAAT